MLTKGPNQPLHVSWPLNSQKVEAMDTMFRQLYSTVKLGVFNDYVTNQDAVTILNIKNNHTNYYAGAGLFFVNDTVTSPGLQYNSSDNRQFGGANSFNIFAGSNVPQYNDLAVWAGAGPAPIIFIKGSTGQVGFNTTTPAYSVDITGTLNVTGALTAGSLTPTAKLGLAYGGTNADLSATGGANQVLRQSSVGGAITVSTIASTNLSNSSNIPLLNANNAFTGVGTTTFAGSLTGTWIGTKVGLLYGGTNADLSATGGTNQLLMQSSVGAAITVGTIASANLSDTSNIPLLNVSNTFSGNPTVFTKINAQAGAANAPSLYFGTTNTGLYGSSNTVDVAIGASQVLSIGSTIIDTKNSFIQFNTTSSGASTPSLGTTAPSSASLVWVRINVSGVTKYFPAWG